MKPHLTFVASALLAALVPASAQVVFNESFDTAVGTPPFYGTGTVSYVSGANITGQAVQLGMTFAEWGQDLAYQLQRGAMEGNTSALLGDYVLSFDLYQTGITAESPVMRFRIEGWADAGFSGATSASGEASVEIPDEGVWTSYDYNLGSTLPAGTFDPLSGTWQIIFNPKAWEVGGPGTYTLLIDNVALTQVSAIPEPSAFAIVAGLAALGLGVGRRRRA